MGPTLASRGAAAFSLRSCTPLHTADMNSRCTTLKLLAQLVGSVLLACVVLLGAAIAMIA